VIAWLEAECWFRVLTIAGGGIVLFLLLWQCWLRPVQQKTQWLEQQEQKQLRNYQKQLLTLFSLPPLTQLEQQYSQLGEQIAAASGPRFSLPALLVASGGELEHWQPEERGGELALRLHWQQAVALLDYLMLLKPAVAIPALTLTGPSPQLHLLMKLHDEG